MTEHTDQLPRATSAEAGQWLTLAVVERVESADDIIALVLASPDGAALASWSPGSHVDVEAGDQVRQYSLCGDPGDATSWRIGILKGDGEASASAWLHAHAQLGRELRVRGPRNHFELRPAPRYVFVAGGIGITPILPMAAHAKAEGIPYRLFYGGSARMAMGFLGEVLEHHADVTDVVAGDEAGLLDLDAIEAELRPDDAVYCCGPAGLLDAMEERAQGWRSQTLRLERFTAKSLEAPAWSGSFDVVLSTSGATITVSPEQSILDAVELNGTLVFSSCREGTCGTCETPVIDGLPDHRDSVLTEEEQAANETMMICVSRSRGPRLTLDL